MVAVILCLGTVDIGSKGRLLPLGESVIETLERRMKLSSSNDSE